MSWTYAGIMIGLFGIGAAYQYDPLKPWGEEPAYAYLVMFVMFMIPNIFGVGRILGTEVQAKTMKLKQLLLHAVLFGIQVSMIAYLVFLHDELPLSPGAAQVLILSAALAFAIQAVIVDRALKRLPDKKGT